MSTRERYSRHKKDARRRRGSIQLFKFPLEALLVKRIFSFLPRMQDTVTNQATLQMICIPFLICQQLFCMTHTITLLYIFATQFCLTLYIGVSRVKLAVFSKSCG